MDEKTLSGLDGDEMNTEIDSYYYYSYWSKREVHL
ncbi:hypothetical protein T07_4217 [Trichinella nelsoni]|uniref:Uncharacterized protein n=1 Tax=Trichinella nelsoni TaxID=6336 RepID=A0A0V0RC36_9BILA|nr:hypothetical protein T07_4217 [Trichinella nelsoni]